MTGDVTVMSPDRRFTSQGLCSGRRSPRDPGSLPTSNQAASVLGRNEGSPSVSHYSVKCIYFKGLGTCY